jgi:hypothetical protein
VRPNLIVRRAQKVADADMRSEGGLSRRKRGCWGLKKYPGIGDRIVMQKPAGAVRCEEGMEC